MDQDRSKIKILLISEHPKITAPFKRALERSGFSVSGNRLASVRGREPGNAQYDLVISFWKTGKNGCSSSGAAEYMDALFMSGDHKETHRVAAFQNGIYACGSSDVNIIKFIQTVEELLREKDPGKDKSKRSESNPQKRPDLKDIIGQSLVMKDLKKTIQKISQQPDMPVLITGETGTGKELAADALHYSSPRRDKPFVKINCSAIPETLLESHLFGHVKGAFTGASKDQTGLFEKASGGTVLLDEIGEMNPRLQPKLLRFLESRTFTRVGDHNEIHVDVWVLAATNADLSRRIKEGSFRKDLYYRLNMVKLELPPLRDRKGDIPSLIHSFLKQEASGPVLFKPEVKNQLHKYNWPGNVRELKNLVRYLQRCRKSGYVGMKDLPEEFKKEEKRDAIDQFPFTLSEIEKKHVLVVFKENEQRIRKTARVLGIDRNTLKKRLIKYGIFID